MEVSYSNDAKKFPILTDNKVVVKDTLVKSDMDTLEEATEKPSLTFTAYAVQKANFSTAELAWDEAKKLG